MTESCSLANFPSRELTKEHGADTLAKNGKRLRRDSAETEVGRGAPRTSEG